MADYTTKDAVGFAVDGKSQEFKNAIHDILADRVQSAIELKKIDVTANFMKAEDDVDTCLLYTSPSPGDVADSRRPSCA